MVTKYISKREKVTEHIKAYSNNPNFEAKPDVFIASICVALGVKEDLVKDVINNFVKANILVEEYGFIISKVRQEMLAKSIGEKEADEEFKKMGL